MRISDWSSDVCSSDLEEPLAADADEAVTARGHAGLALAVVDMDVDIVPVRELVDHHLGADRVVLGKMFHRLVGKDHAPAEVVARTVALEHGDLMLRISELNRNREIEPRGASAKACDFHMRSEENTS